MDRVPAPTPEVSMTKVEGSPVVPRSIPCPETPTVDGSSFKPEARFGPTTILNGDPGMWTPLSFACCNEMEKMSVLARLRSRLTLISLCFAMDKPVLVAQGFK